MHAVPTGRNREVVAFAEALDPVMTDYYASHVFPIMREVQATAARHEHNPELTSAVGQLGAYLQSMPERVINEISRTPSLEDVARNGIGDPEELHRRMLAVSRASRGYHPNHPDFGPTKNLERQLQRLYEATSARAMDEHVVAPTLDSMGHTS